jgi:hypothetical protein
MTPTVAAEGLKKYTKPQSAQRFDLKSFTTKRAEPHTGQKWNLSKGCKGSFI